MYFVYRHIRVDKDEPFYIGMGRIYAYDNNPYKRAYVRKKRNKIWNSIVSKTDYKVEVFYESENKNIIISKESEFIKLYGRIDLKTGILANMSDGGEGAFNMSPETKKKLSERMKGNTICKGLSPSEYSKSINSLRLKGNCFFKGKTHTDEAKLKISKAKKGKSLSDIHKSNLIGTRKSSKKIYCSNGVNYNSICECVRILFECKCPSKSNKFRNYKNHISLVCNGKKESYKGYKFKFI